MTRTVQTVSGALQSGVVDRQAGDPAMLMVASPDACAVMVQDRLVVGPSDTSSLIVTASPATSGSPQSYDERGRLTLAVPPTASEIVVPLSASRNRGMPVPAGLLLALLLGLGSATGGASSPHPHRSVATSASVTRVSLMSNEVSQIEQLKHRYLRHLDLKQWDDFALTLAPDVTADYAGLAFDGRDSLVAYMRENLGPRMITLHQAHNPEITVEGDTATGIWYLEDKVLMPDFDLVLEGAAFYTDRYRRTADGWVIAHTGYRRTYELTSPLVGNLRIGDAYAG